MSPRRVTSRRKSKNRRSGFAIVDGRKLVAHFEGKGLKSATIKKKLMWLTAAVDLAIKEGKLLARFNTRPIGMVIWRLTCLRHRRRGLGACYG